MPLDARTTVSLSETLTLKYFSEQERLAETCGAAIKKVEKEVQLTQPLQIDQKQVLNAGCNEQEICMPNRCHDQDLVR